MEETPMRFTSMLTIGLLVACGGDDDATDTTNAENACTNSISSTWPEDLNQEVFYASNVEFTLTALDGSETIDVVDGTGATVEGTTSVVDQTVIFTPATTLASSTEYTVTYGWCGGPTTTSWMTSIVGDPATPADLIGNTYLLDLSSGRWTKPEGVGSMIGSLIGDAAAIYIGVKDATETEVTMLGALGDENMPGMQDMCTESLDLGEPADFTNNPQFVVESPLLSLSVAGVDVAIEDMLISGAFAPDGSVIAGAQLAGTLDVTVLGDLLDGDPCALLVAVGVACEPCSDGTGDHCLSVQVEDMDAAIEPGLTLEPLTTDDIDYAIAAGTCEPPATTASTGSTTP
jgi:hypothetical protein